MEKLIVFMILAVCILNLIPKNRKRTKRTRTERTELAPVNSLAQYNPKPLTTPSELKFLSLLENSCPELRFHSQVCMGALLHPRVTGKDAFFKSRGKIASKIIDFVAQDRMTGQVIALIELDDPTHDSEEAKARDAERDRYTASAGFKTFRWDVRALPEVMEIRRALINTNNQALPVANSVPEIKEPEPELVETEEIKEEITIWRKYVLGACIAICLVYLMWPAKQIGANTINKASNAAISSIANNNGMQREPTIVLATSNTEAKAKLGAVIKMLDSDIRSLNLDKNIAAVMSMNENLNSYVQTLNTVSPSECMSLPYRRASMGLSAYLMAGKVLHEGLRSLPSPFNAYVTSITKGNLEDSKDFEKRMRLRVELTSGHSTEPSYIAYRLAVYGSDMFGYARDTMAGCR